MDRSTSHPTCCRATTTIVDVRAGVDREGPGHYRPACRLPVPRGPCRRRKHRAPRSLRSHRGCRSSTRWRRTAGRGKGVGKLRGSGRRPPSACLYATSATRTRVLSIAGLPSQWPAPLRCAGRWSGSWRPSLRSPLAWSTLRLLARHRAPCPAVGRTVASTGSPRTNRQPTTRFCPLRESTAVDATARRTPGAWIASRAVMATRMTTTRPARVWPTISPGGHP